VLNQPGAPFPLQRLADLYRKRDGNLDKLVAEFEQKASQGGPEQYNAEVALGGIYRQAGQPERAIPAYQRAIARAPQNPIALMALAQLHQDQNDAAKARTNYEAALPLLKSEAERELVLRLLMKLHLDLDELDAAKKVHRRLVDRAKGSFFVEAELGAELLQRGKLQPAEAEFRRVVQAARGDNRALAPALRDLGTVLAKQGKHEQALTTLQRALGLTSAQSGLRRELLEVMVTVYRDGERLAELVTLLEQEAGADFARLRLLGGLYEELGRIEDALKTYEKALRRQPKDLEVRLRKVSLLQIQGQLDQAVDEYRALIKAAPSNPDFVFRLVEALLQRGERDRAVAELVRLEQRSQGDDQVLTALVDFYERVGESARSLKLLERLSQTGGGDPQHLVELGDRYYREGDKAKAERTWKRLLVVVPSKPRALQILGEVYLDHDMPDEALRALEEATRLAPDQKKLTKALALALERAGAGATKGIRLKRYAEALRLWERLLGESEKDGRLAREARQHIVTLWGLGGTLEKRIAPLERNMKTEPPDLNSGRLLAQIYTRLKRPTQAARVLKKVVALAPGDGQSQLMLEQALVAQGKLAEAIEVLQKLALLEPSRAREYYQRMAKYSAQIYQDADAIRFAAKAVALSPDDAAGHKNLADMYARRQDTERAIHEYREAIAKNDRLFPAYFALAELLLTRQRVDEADRLLRRVMRSALDEELLTRATRSSMQINLSRDSLESLEKELLPIALANPGKPIYRRLLVEIYGALTFPLIQEVRSADPETRSAAAARLRRIGQRAVKPLLDTLADARETQQQTAIDLLTHLRNEHASQALFVFASGDGEAELRVRAMIAAGATQNEAMLANFEELLFSEGVPHVDEGDPVVLAAVWGLCQLDSKRARALTASLLQSDSPTAQTLSIVSLALRRDRSIASEVKELLTSTEHGNFPRAAAAFAVGALGTARDHDELSRLTRVGDERVRATALVALARLGSDQAGAAIAHSLVSGSESLRDAAVRAAGVLMGAAYVPRSDPLAPPEARVDASELLERLSPQLASPEAEARAIVSLEEPLAEAVGLAVQRSPEQALSISSALLARQGTPAFGLLSARLAEASEETRRKAEAALERIAERAVPPFAGLSSHPSVQVRTSALLFLATRTESVARAAMIAGLRDTDERVRQLAANALAVSPALDALEALVQMLAATERWNERVHAVQALAQFGVLREQAVADPRYASAVAAVSQLAEKDPFAFVREAAAHTAYHLQKEGARPLLRRVAQQDPEARVREAATALLSRIP
jgi:tetratricopeptide (TPR) repeat protein/HEAT repeat protein